MNKLAEDLADASKREGMIKRTCLGRLGGMRVCLSTSFALTITYFPAPDDIAGPVVFLASDLYVDFLPSAFSSNLPPVRSMSQDHPY